VADWTEKKQVLETLLARGDAYIHLDPRADGVCVPSHLQRQAALVLVVGLEMPIPIPDLRIDQDGIAATLSFSGRLHPCFVPWRSVYAIRNMDWRGLDWRGLDWPEDIVMQAPKAPTAFVPSKLCGPGTKAPFLQRIK
jgi:hypothetical protein